MMMQEALQNIDASFDLIEDFVSQTSQESTKLYDVCPSQLLLFSSSQANAFSETLLTFRRVLHDTIKRCERVKEVIAESGDKLSTVMMHKQIQENRSHNENNNNEGVNNDNDENNNTNNKRPSSSSFLNVASDIRQQAVRAAPETADATEMRTMNQLFRQISENQTTSEVFAEMALVAKVLEDLRHHQDLNVLYKARAEELQAQVSSNNSNHNDNKHRGSTFAVPPLLLPAATGEQDAAVSASSASTSHHHAELNKVANDLGRLTTMMKEKWELAEADKALAEANVIALESENALLANRVKDLEERLSLSSNAAAERKVLLERERARSAKLLSKSKSRGGTATSGTSDDELYDSINNNNNKKSFSTPNNRRSIGSAHHDHRRNNNIRTSSGGGSSGGRASSGEVSSNGSQRGVSGGRPLSSATIGSAEESPILKNNNNDSNSKQQKKSTPTTTGGNNGRAGTAGSDSSSVSMMKRVLLDDSATITNNNKVAAAAAAPSSGICIDGVELSQEFAVWMAKVHRLLSKDKDAEEALFELEKDDEDEKKAAAKEKSSNSKSKKNTSNKVETPFQRFMANQQQQKR